MNMKQLNDEAIKFFTLAINDVEEGIKLRIRYLREASLAFLSKPCAETAAEVYNSFFDCYRMRNEEFAFYDILDALREYEETSSSFVENKRDHFTHSVWVFFMGLGIFSTNTRYRDVFGRSANEFMYEWGLVSLVHDIGYPVEISFQQFKQYIEKMIVIDGDGVNPNPYFEYNNFDGLIHFYGDEKESIIHMLATNVAHALDLDVETIIQDLYNYPSIRGKKGFVDHGFYSAIMLMHWNEMLNKHSQLEDELFSKITINAASAILLHNYFKRPLISQYCLSPLNVNQHPLAFLIMLCDELQEWDRIAYGKENQKKPIVEEFEMQLSEDKFIVRYGLDILLGSNKEGVAEKFSQNKVDTLLKLLDLKDIFPKLASDFVTSTISSNTRKINLEGDKLISPRPLFEDLENVAKVIHENYRKKYKDSTAGQKTWEECDDHYKYDNISQARHLFSAVAKYGYFVLDKDIDMLDKYNAVDSIDTEFVEDFACIEHDRWMANKIQDGWSYGKVRDNEKKLHPSIIKYQDLSEDEKDKDRAPLIEFIDTLDTINKSLYKLKD